MDRDELLVTLGRAIYSDAALSDHDWDTVSVVFTADEESASWYGYSYRGREPTAVALEADELFELVLAFQAATVSPNGRVWKACLFQLDRRTGQLEVAFEHESADRWKVTPDTIDVVPEQIRMKGDGLGAEPARASRPPKKKTTPAPKKKTPATKKKTPATSAEKTRGRSGRRPRDE